MRIVFMGTPDFAAAHLRRLIDDGCEIALAVTQPDKPRGRGHTLMAPPVKLAALEAGIPVYQPVSLRSDEVRARLSELEPELFVVVAYGKLLPPDILALPKLGAVNIHASLLPKYRGAAPIQWAVLNGDRVTGVTSMYLGEGLDDGDIIYRSELEIGSGETSGELFDRLCELGAELLSRTVYDIGLGIAPRTAQDESRVSQAPPLTREMSPLDFSGRGASELRAWVYGLQPWPIASMEYGGVRLRVFAAETTETGSELEPGTVISADGAGIEVVCRGGETLLITEVQAPNKRRMSAGDFLRGFKPSDGGGN